MAISKKIEGSFKTGRSNHTYSVEVYDMVSTVPISEKIILGTNHFFDGTGFELDFNGEQSIHDRIIGTSASIGLLIKLDAVDITVVQDFINTVLSNEEGRFGVAIKKDGAMIYAGSVQKDGLRITEESPYFRFNIYSTDELGRLNGVFYSPDGTANGNTYDGFEKLTDIVTKALSKITYIELFDSFNDDAEVLATDTNYYAVEMESGGAIDTSTDDPLYLTKVYESRFVKVNLETGDVESSTCNEVATEVARTQGARLFQSEGKFWLVSWNKHSFTNLKVKYYDQYGSNVANSEISQRVTIGNDQPCSLMATPQRYMLPPVRSAYFLHKKSDYVDSLLLVPFLATATDYFNEYTLGTFSQSTDNSIRIKGTFEANFDVDSQLTYATVTVGGFTYVGSVQDFSARLQVIVKCGAKYLYSPPEPSVLTGEFIYSWVDDTSGGLDVPVATLDLIDGGTNLESVLSGDTYYEIHENLSFEFDTGSSIPGFPVDGELTVQFFIRCEADDLDYFIANPTNISAYEAPSSAFTYPTIPNIQIKEINSGNESENYDIKYSMNVDSVIDPGEISQDSINYQLESAYFIGGQNANQSTRYLVWDGSGYVFSSNWKYNGLGAERTYQDTFLYDFIRFQANTIERLKCSITMSSHDVWPHKTLLIGSEVFAMLNARFDSNNDMWEGEWALVIETARTATPVTHEPPVRGTTKGNVKKFKKGINSNVKSISAIYSSMLSVNHTQGIAAGTITSLITKANWTRVGVLDTGNTIRVVRSNDLTYEDFEVSAKTTSGTNTISVTSKAIIKDIPQGSYIIFEPEYFATKINS